MLMYDFANHNVYYTMFWSLITMKKAPQLPAGLFIRLRRINIKNN
jgi:hypothetical protein